MLNLTTDTIIKSIEMDFEPSSKKKKTRRGKRCGRKARIALFQKENQLDNGKYLDSLDRTSNCDRLSDAGNVGETCWDCNGRRMNAVRTSVNGLKHTRSTRCLNMCIRPRYNPKAPHNSTQFIMNEHEDFDVMCRGGAEENFLNFTDDREFYEEISPEKDNIINSIKQKSYSKCDDSNFSNNNDLDLSDDFEMNCNFNEADSVMFMMNDFEQMYDSIRSEQLSHLSKSELIHAITNLEKDVTIKERKLVNFPLCSRRSFGLTHKKNNSASLLKSNNEDLLNEWNQLKSENLTLKSEIKALQNNGNQQ